VDGSLGLFCFVFSKENCNKFHHYFVLSFEWSSLERPLKKNTDLFEKTFAVMIIFFFFYLVDFGN